jgi:hypothetical protein
VAHNEAARKESSGRPGGVEAYPEAVIAVTVSPQPYSATGFPLAPMARLVPPTPVAQASEVGNATFASPMLSSLPSPSSPDAKFR